MIGRLVPTLVAMGIVVLFLGCGDDYSSPDAPTPPPQRTVVAQGSQSGIQVFSGTGFGQGFGLPVQTSVLGRLEALFPDYRDISRRRTASRRSGRTRNVERSTWDVLQAVSSPRAACGLKPVAMPCL
jgi:hypothetical protein